MPNWKKIIVSGSDASLSSAYIEGNLTASAAYLTSASIGHLETIYETASVIYSSGSTKFGDTSDDTHEYTGSLFISGGISIVEGAQLTGTSSFAITASHALNVPDTASHALTAVTSSHTAGTASIANFATTASFAITASHLIGNTGNSGSFSGSFEGDGSALTGITVSSTTLASASFSSVSSYTASHALDSTELTITVYDNDNNQILPENIRILDSANVGLDFGGTTVSGKVVLAKGGHIVSGTLSVAEETTVTASFNSSFYTASHEFGTRNVNVTVYDNDYNQILPENIRILDTASVGLDFGGTTVEGNIVITKGGHIVSGSSVSASLAETASFYGGSVTSASFAETASFYGGSVTSASFAETASFYGGSVTSASLAETASFYGGSVTSASFAETSSYSHIASQSVNNNTASGSLSFWQGSQTEYDALGSYDNNTVYFVV